MAFREVWGGILEEMQGALGTVSEQEVASFCEELATASAVFVTGEGRSGLVGRCFAMRLMHIGLPAHVVGGTTTPRLGPGDLLVAVSGAGETAVTCTVAKLAAEGGGRVVVVTAAPRSTLASVAQAVVHLPIGPAGGSKQYGGSLFEQASLVLLDAVALLLQQRLGVSAEAMGARHTNLE